MVGGVLGVLTTTRTSPAPGSGLSSSSSARTGPGSGTRRASPLSHSISRSSWRPSRRSKSARWVSKSSNPSSWTSSRGGTRFSPRRFVRGVLLGCGHQPEIGRSSVRADQEPAPEVIEFELVGPTPRNQPPGRRIRIGARDRPGLGAVGLLAVEQHELPRTALVGGHPEGLVRLLVHQGVLLDGLPEAVQHHLRPAEGLVIGPGIEHGVPRRPSKRRSARRPGSGLRVLPRSGVSRKRSS